MEDKSDRGIGTVLKKVKLPDVQCAQSSLMSEAWNQTLFMSQHMNAAVMKRNATKCSGERRPCFTWWKWPLMMSHLKMTWMKPNAAVVAQADALDKRADMPISYVLQLNRTRTQLLLLQEARQLSKSR